MKKPMWTKVVGVIGIILGCFALLGASQAMSMCQTIEMEKKKMPEMKKNIQKMLESHNVSPEQVQEYMNMAQDIWKGTPEWLYTWCIVSGIILLVIAVFYLYASIGLLRLQTSAVKMFYIAAGVSICFGIIKGLVLMKYLSHVHKSLMARGILGIYIIIFGIIIDIILLIVVARGDKQAFASGN